MLELTYRFQTFFVIPLAVIYLVKSEATLKSMIINNYQKVSISNSDKSILAFLFINLDMLELFYRFQPLTVQLFVYHASFKTFIDIPVGCFEP